MTTWTPKQFAWGYLANTETEIFTQASGGYAEIHNIIIHNKNTTTETVTLTLNDGSFSNTIYKMQLVANETVHLTFPNEGLLLISNTNYNFSGLTTTASKVTIKIDGSLRTP